MNGDGDVLANTARVDCDNDNPTVLLVGSHANPRGRGISGANANRSGANELRTVTQSKRPKRANGARGKMQRESGLGLGLSKR